MIRIVERATPPYSREELRQYTHKNHTSYVELQKLTCKRSLSMFYDSRLSPSQKLEKIRTPVSRFKAMTPPPSITIPYSPASIQKRLSVLVCWLKLHSLLSTELSLRPASRDEFKSYSSPAFEAQKNARCGCVEGLSAARVKSLRGELIEKGLWVSCWERRLLEANKDYNKNWPHVWWPRVRYSSTGTPNDVNLS